MDSHDLSIEPTRSCSRHAESHDLSFEPSAIRQLTPAEKDRLTDLLDGYLRRLEQGLPPPRGTSCGRIPSWPSP